MRGRPIVLLGEIHDNGAQHTLRLAALRRVVAEGGRPAIAFEQFDREQQPEIDRARRERPGDAGYLIARASPGESGWDWTFYRPFVELALANDLPIVAANLSRRDAGRVIRDGFGSVFDSEVAVPDRMSLDRIPMNVLKRHEQAVAEGHCGLLPTEALPAMARAQLARDRVLADSIRPYFSRGVVLLTGNGHVRKDIGIPIWLTPNERSASLVVELAESTNIRTGDGTPPTANEADRDRYDLRIATPAIERPDPCEALRQRFSRPASR